MLDICSQWEHIFLNEGNPFSTKKSIVTVLRAGPKVNMIIAPRMPPQKYQEIVYLILSNIYILIYMNFS